MNDKKIPINISISKKLLSQIEANIEGKDRSEKITTCVSKGYQILNGE